MILLGLDPGLATTGYAIVNYQRPATNLPRHGGGCQLLDFGTIETPKNTPLPSRLHTIQTDLSELLRKYKPKFAIIEKLFFAKNTKTALDVAQARGVLIAILHHHGVEIHEITPNEVKLSLTGDGKADKLQIQKMLMLTLKLPSPPKPDDAADAIAIALSYNKRG